MRTPAQLVSTPALDQESRIQENQTMSNIHITTGEGEHMSLTEGSGFSVINNIHDSTHLSNIASGPSELSYHSKFDTVNKRFIF